MPCPKDHSRVDATGRAYAGSQRQTQTYVNERHLKLNSAIAQSLSQYNVDEQDLCWVSPLASDTYSEYRDSEFLQRVGLGSLSAALLEFWPHGGPCWDALARTADGCVLLEAKSRVREVYGDGCKASPTSRHKIVAALDATKSWLGVSPAVDWTGRLYQSANRYAYLFFLRKVARLPAFLVNVYFIGDPHSRTTRSEWDAAIEKVNEELGLKGEVPFSGSIFLDV